MDEFLTKRKFTKTDIKSIKEKIKSSGTNKSEQEIISLISFLLDLMKYTPKEVAQMIRIDHYVLFLDSNTLSDAITKLYGLGYSEDQLKKMLLLCPSVAMIPSVLIEKMVIYLEGYGFSKEQITVFTSRDPAFFKFSVDYVDRKLKMLENLTFTKKQIIMMISFSPLTIKDDKEDFMNSIDFLGTYDFDLAQSLHIISYLSDRIKNDKSGYAKKLDIVRKYGLTNVILDYPMSLILRTELIMARISFLELEEIPIFGMVKYHVFRDNNAFKSLYGRTSSQLIDSYRLRLELSKKKDKPKRHKNEPKEN
ncbi:MAG: hypothetical protein HFG33_02765 [Bacilli bacterium]|nr:hypothetical protein [Bacilli bacterium]